MSLSFVSPRPWPEDQYVETSLIGAQYSRHYSLFRLRVRLRLRPGLAFLQTGTEGHGLQFGAEQAAEIVSIVGVFKKDRKILCFRGRGGGINVSRAVGLGGEERSSKVVRSQSMKKPFQKLGDGFLKTFLNLKKK